MLNVEQFASTQKASFGILYGASARAFEGLEKLVALNLQAGKASLAEVAETAQAALAIKDVQELVALQTTAVQPTFEKLSAYAKQAYDIVVATNGDIAKLAEEGSAEAQKAFIGAVDAAFKDAPAGSEKAVEFIQSAVAAANSAYDTVQKAVKQVADVAEANVEAVAATAAKSTGTRARRAP
jgi:phasin family protein